jgi:hypothetical protein
VEDTLNMQKKHKHLHYSRPNAEKEMLATTKRGYRGFHHSKRTTDIDD